jgi:hypothetical protein
MGDEVIVVDGYGNPILIFLAFNLYSCEDGGLDYCGFRVCVEEGV